MPENIQTDIIIISIITILKESLFVQKLAASPCAPVPIVNVTPNLNKLLKASTKIETKE